MCHLSVRPPSPASRQCSLPIHGLGPVVIHRQHPERPRRHCDSQGSEHVPHHPGSNHIWPGERDLPRRGIAFQIQDDIIEAEGNTEQIGKPSQSDEDKDKATFPKIIGLDASKRRVLDLFNQSNDAISVFGEKSEGLKYLAKIITERTS